MTFQEKVKANKVFLIILIIGIIIFITTFGVATFLFTKNSNQKQEEVSRVKKDKVKNFTSTTLEEDMQELENLIKLKMKNSISNTKNISNTSLFMHNDNATHALFGLASTTKMTISSSQGIPKTKPGKN